MSGGERPGVLLSLGGGGVRGLAHLSVLRVLEKKRIEILGVTGVSSGAIIAAAHAFGIKADPEDYIKALSDPALAALTSGGKVRFVRHAWRVGANLYSVLRRASVFNEAPLKRGLAGLFGDRRLEESPTPLAVVAADLDSSEAIVLREGSVVDALYASSALPGIFPPAQIDGRLLVDGGIVTKVPVGAARTLSLELSHQNDRVPVVGVDVSNPPQSRKNAGLRTAIESALLGWEISRRRIAEIDLMSADLAVRLHPERPIGAFEVERAQEIMRLGESAANRIAPSLIALFSEDSRNTETPENLENRLSPKFPDFPRER